MTCYLVKRPDGLFLIRGFKRSAFFSPEKHNAKRFTNPTVAKEYADRFGGDVVTHEV